MFSEEYPFCFDTLLTFEGLKIYIQKASTLFTTLKDIEFAQLEERKKKSHRPRWHSERWQHNRLFPMALNYSFVVLLFIEIETRLQQTCDLLKKLKGLPLRARDLRGDNIEQCVLFLEKFLEIQRNDLPDWQNISDLSKIRHCIVHTAGRIKDSKDNKYLRTLLGKYPHYFSLSTTDPESELLIIDHQYCLAAADFGKSFFEGIFQKTGLHYDIGSQDLVKESARHPAEG